MWPDKLFSCTYGGCPWLGIASCPPSLAPHLAPRNTAAPDPPAALLVPGWPWTGRPARLPHSTARGNNSGGRPTSNRSRTAASRSPRTAGTARSRRARQDSPAHHNQGPWRGHDATPAARTGQDMIRSRQDSSAIADERAWFRSRSEIQPLLCPTVSGQRRLCAALTRIRSWFRAAGGPASGAAELGEAEPVYRACAGRSLGQAGQRWQPARC